jgi:outer membrane receptor protein involved in Fe transport
MPHTKTFSLVPFAFLSLLAIAFLLCLSADAQVSTASLTGTVIDPSSAAIVGAEVTLKNTATGIERKTNTNGSGTYSFDFVPIGTYSLQVSQAGFQIQKQSAVTLTAADQERIDFTLPVAKDTIVVEVNTSGQALDTITPQQIVSIDQVAINELPVSRQDWTSVLQLGPGLSTEGGGPSPAGTSLTINGLPPAGFNLTVDGTNATSDPETPAFGFYQAPNIINTINNDAIAEVSVVKGIAGAQIGGTMSGNVNIITKSGTNRFHGSLYEINDVSAFDARNPFVTKKPRSTFNEFGGSIGGPIFRNKLFFFGSYEGARLSAYQAISATVPTPLFRSLSPSVFSPVINAFPAIAQPSDPTALVGQYFGTGSVRQTDGNGVARFDYNPNENNLIYARYIRARPYKLSPNAISINSRNTTGHSDAFNIGYTHAGHGWTAMTRYGYNRVRLQRLDLGFGSDLEQITVVGINSAGAEQFLKSGLFNTGEQQFAKTFGNHSMTAGVIVQRQDAGRTDYNTASFSYASMNDYVSNIPNQVQITFDLDPFNLYFYQYGGFLQDDWKVRPNLTLNLGVRYDYFTVPKEDNGRIFNRGVDVSNPALGPGFGNYRPANSMYDGDFNNVQPRAGFAWTPGGSQNTVVRGGSGIFVSPHPIFGGPIDLVQNSASQPFRVTLTGSQAANSGLKYPLPRSGFNQALANLQSSGVISSQVVNTTINGNFPNPYSIQWMLGIEQTLPFSHRIEIDYIGNRALKLNMTETKNLPDRVTGVLPRPTYSQFRYYYPGDASNYNGLQVQLIKAPWNGLSYGLSYAWSKVLSFADANLLLQTPPQDNDKIRADYGPPSFDMRNRLTANFMWVPPITRWANLNNRAAKMLLDGWQISGIVKARSGMPFNILNGNSSYPSDRPDGINSVNRYFTDYRTTRKYLNRASFASVPVSTASKAQVRGGTLGRYAIVGPGSLVVDASIAKSFQFTESVRFQLRADAFNSLNHANYGGMVTNFASGTFGQLTSATARTVQIAGRLTF